MYKFTNKFINSYFWDLVLLMKEKIWQADYDIGLLAYKTCIYICISQEAWKIGQYQVFLFQALCRKNHTFQRKSLRHSRITKKKV